MPFLLSILRNKLFLSAALFLSVLIVYFPVLGHGFLHFDDHRYITQNPFVLKGLSWEGLKWAFFSYGVDNWIPLTWLSHMLDVQIFGLRAGGHHFVNILFHAVNGVLLFNLFERLTGRQVLSWLVAFIFALHPMHVESVAWISERKDVLSTFFIFLSMHFYVASLSETPGVEAANKPLFLGNLFKFPQNAWRFGWALFFFVLSLLTKPMYVTFPILLFIFDFWPLRRFLSAKEFMRCAIQKWPFVIASLGVGIITIVAQQHAGAVLTSEELPLGYRVMAAFMATSSYIQKFFYPEMLSIFYPAFSMHDYQAWASSSFLVLTGVSMIIVISFRKKSQWALAGWLLFLISLLPVLGFVKAGSQSIADRYTYFAYIGLSILLLWTGEAWIKKRPFLKIPLMAALILWLGLCVLKTADRIQEWRTTETLFQSAIRLHPNNYVAFKVLADDAYHRGDLIKAADYIEQSLRVLPPESESARLGYELNLAVVYHQSERFDLAAPMYEKVTERMLLRPDLLIALGDVYMKLNQPARARLQYEKALPLLPGNQDLQEKLSRSKAI